MNRSSPPPDTMFVGVLEAEGRTDAIIEITDDHTLLIRGPFGQLMVPYDVISMPTNDAWGPIRLNVRGMKLLLDPRLYGDKSALFTLLQEKIRAARASSSRSDPQVPKRPSRERPARDQ